MNYITTHLHNATTLHQDVYCTFLYYTSCFSHCVYLCVCIFTSYYFYNCKICQQISVLITSIFLGFKTVSRNIMFSQKYQNTVSILQILHPFKTFISKILYWRQAPKGDSYYLNYLDNATENSFTFSKDISNVRAKPFHSCARGCPYWLPRHLNWTFKRQADEAWC